MSGNSIHFDDKKIKKVTSTTKEKYGKYNSFKYFIGYNGNDIIKQLYLQLSQMTGYISKFKNTKIFKKMKIKTQ